MRALRVDSIFAALLGILVLAGALIFASAAFGLLARGEDHIYSVAFNHLALGIGIGLVALFVASHLPTSFLRRFAPHLFIASILLTAAVFIPHLGFEHGGGRRWLDLSVISVQPSEFLKLGAILMAAAYFAALRKETATLRFGLGGALLVLLFPVVILLAQPDLGTLGIIVFSVLSVYFAAGARWRDMATLIAVGIVGIAILAYARPYVLDRIVVFLDPAHAPHQEGYQLRQSLIAIGSGGAVGRGFGQGIQKFTYLPEPMGDSIFAVLAEEFGFIGSVTFILLFAALALRGYFLAARMKDRFAALLTTGLSSYLCLQAFINIAAMLGLAPLTGVPLTFISQGGSAMLAALAGAGIILGASRAAIR
jgi:cell division protein FtsW